MQREVDRLYRTNEIFCPEITDQNPAKEVPAQPELIPSVTEIAIATLLFDRPSFAEDLRRRRFRVRSSSII